MRDGGWTHFALVAFSSYMKNAAELVAIAARTLSQIVSGTLTVRCTMHSSFLKVLYAYFSLLSRPLPSFLEIVSSSEYPVCCATVVRVCVPNRRESWRGG